MHEVLLQEVGSAPNFFSNLHVVVEIQTTADSTACLNASPSVHKAGSAEVFVGTVIWDVAWLEGGKEGGL